jgi:serine/threonine-protein kinase
VVEADGKILVVSDFVPATDAGRFLGQRAPLPVREAVMMLAQILDVLEFAHTRGQVHGDIKPTNVLLQQKESKAKALLTDFGLARVYQASRLSGLSMTRAILGSGAFFPPERILKYRDVLPAGDQYGAGATLYHLLTGQGHFEPTNTLAKRLTRMLRSDQIPILKRRADLPAELVAVIHRSLARDPGQRFDHVGEFKQALLAAIK